MKSFKVLGTLGVATLALMVFASNATATTLEVEGVAKNSSVEFSASLSGSSLWTDTFGGFINTCTGSNLEGYSETTTGPSVAGYLWNLSFWPCTEDAKERVTVDGGASLSFESISGTTNGTVHWANGIITTPSPFGRLTCTGAGVNPDLGKLTGVKSGYATLDVNAVLSCGIITGKWSATYRITRPWGLGITA